MTNKRCDTCTAKETLRPETLGDVLSYLAPPISLLNYLDKVIQAKGDNTPADIREYREKWRTLNAGDPMPEVDRFDIPVQATIIEGKAIYE